MNFFVFLRLGIIKTKNEEPDLSKQSKIMILSVWKNFSTQRQFCDFKTKYFQNEYLCLFKTRYNKNQKVGARFIKTVQNIDFWVCGKNFPHT